MSYYEFHVARRYVQFEGALRELPNYAALIGRKVLFLTACDPVTEQVTAKIREGLEKPAAYWMNKRLAAESPRYARYMPITDRLDELRAKMEFLFYDLGETIVAEENIGRLASWIRERDIDTVVGIGGGKGQDFARALTHYLPLKIILVPTLAATNASISTLSVLYTPDGRKIDRYWRMDSAPDLVLADTELLIGNGPRILAAGMGDIMATYQEALCNLHMTGHTDVLPALSYEGVELAARLLREQAPEAVRAASEGVINTAFESVVSMILHNCGPLGMICTLGFAHVLDEVFLHFDSSHKTPHGMRVGYATIPMLLFTGASDTEVAEYVHFCERVGIPTTLSALWLDGFGVDDWRAAYDATVGVSGTIGTLPFAVTREQLLGSLEHAERFVKAL